MSQPVSKHSKNLLPRTVGEFADKSYWAKFFSLLEEQRTDAFEWYGEYEDLRGCLDKYLRSADRILQVGCGNSELADRLYDKGFRHVTSIDVIKGVIKQQVLRNKKQRPELTFRVANILEQSSLFLPNSFNAVIDKGTVDALISDNTPHSAENARKMFSNIDKYLAVGGRYLIVSLAQDIVLKRWLEFFTGRYLIRVHRINPRSSSSSMQAVFMLIATKLKSTVAIPPIIEFVHNKSNIIQRMANLDDLCKAVKAAHQYANFCYRASQAFIEDELKIHLYYDSNDNPVYCIYLVHRRDLPNLGTPFAVYVVPSGNEKMYFYSTPDGRQELCRMAHARRLAIVVVCTEGQNQVKSIDEIKSDLNNVIIDFIPSYVADPTSVQIPYLSSGPDVDTAVSVNVLQTFQSITMGSFDVRELELPSGDTKLRQLIFGTSLSLVQSEIRVFRRRLTDVGLMSAEFEALTIQQPVSSTETCDKSTMAGSSSSSTVTSIVAPIIHNTADVLDWSSLSSMHHRAMAAALAVAAFPFDNFLQAPLNICLVGVGGGCLATFLHKHFSEMTITAVELDAVVVEAAQLWFEFNPSERLRCIIDDGVKYLRRLVEEGHRGIYDVIIFDVSGSDVYEGGLLSGPPPDFLTLRCASDVKLLLKPTGALALNLIVRSVTKTQEIKDRFDEVFDCILWHKIDDDLLNQLFICLPQKPENFRRFNDQIHKHLTVLHQYLSRISGRSSCMTTDDVVGVPGGTLEDIPEEKSSDEEDKPGTSGQALAPSDCDEGNVQEYLNKVLKL